MNRSALIDPNVSVWLFDGSLNSGPGKAVSLKLILKAQEWFSYYGFESGPKLAV